VKGSAVLLLLEVVSSLLGDTLSAPGVSQVGLHQDPILEEVLALYNHSIIT
jgi:hypothetical protein